MKILIVDDEVNIVRLLKEIFEEDNHIVETANNGQQGLEKFKQFNPDIVFLDVKMPVLDGVQALEKMKAHNPEPIVIMISGHSNIAIAVKAIKFGAYDFLEKPLSLPLVRVTFHKAKEYYDITHKITNMEEELNAKYEMIGSSPQIKSVIKLIDKVAKTNSKVLIHGESGTGKELVAWAIHHKSDRRNNSFIRFNSAAIPNDLVESELFGYEKGAFTGADTFKKGKIEEADNGTLFLDEIGDMSLSAQAKILRVIQEGEFERVGSNKPIKIDARIIAATHKDLPELVRTGQFREDLYYRLNVVPIEVPALRDRISDIDDLAQHFSKLNAKEMKVSRKTFSKEALDYLKKQRFDGNIRELRNLIERIYIMFDEEMVDLEMLTILNIRSSKGDSFWEDTTTFSEKKIEFERKYLSIQLQKNDYSVSKTSSALGLQQSNLSRKLKDLKISTAKK